MTFGSVDNAIWVAEIFMETVLLGLLAWRRVFETLPAFFVYLLSVLCIDIVTLQFVGSLSSRILEALPGRNDSKCFIRVGGLD
jgi:hypothetical protein